MSTIPFDNIFSYKIDNFFKNKLNKEKISEDNFIKTIKRGDQIVLDKDQGIMNIAHDDVVILVNFKDKKFINAFKNNSYKNWNPSDHRMFYRGLIKKYKGKKRKKEKNINKKVEEELKKQEIREKITGPDTNKSDKHKITVNRQKLNDYLRDKSLEEHKKNPAPVKQIYKRQAILKKVLAKISKNTK